MREILFRGKVIETHWVKEDIRGEWVEGSLVHQTEYYGDPVDRYHILYTGEFDMDYYDSAIVDPKTIGQFTGLLDKNGVKIFEGDIVKFCSGEIRSVVFDENYSEFEFSRKDPVENVDGLALCVDHDVCEVIGNIYDNPELLKEN